MKQNTEKQILELIKSKNRILILPSSPLDGDSLGSALALYLSLKKTGKEVEVAIPEAIPEVFSFLPAIEVPKREISSSRDFIIEINCKKSKIDTIKTEKDDDSVRLIITPKQGSFKNKDISFQKGEQNYDLIITVDTADLSQIQEIYENNSELFSEVPIINIDHHLSNSQFGKINHIDIMSSSTAEMIIPIIDLLSEEAGKVIMDEDIATLLLTGIITDTGSFQNSNTTPKSFKNSALLSSYGARQQDIIQHIYKTKQLSQLKLWGRVLSKIKTDDKHRIVWSIVSLQDIRDTNSSIDEIGDIIDELLSNAPGAEVVILFKEIADDKVDVSLRTTTPAVDASMLAENFGGGGHAQAAGFEFNDSSLIDAEYKTLTYIREIQKQRLGMFTEADGTAENLDEIMEKARKNMEKKEKEEKKKSKMIYKFED